MRITYKGDYALKALIDIGIYEKFGVVSIKDISEREDIPLKFLEQIIISLKKEGIVKSKRGKDGGYMLAVDPSTLTIGTIIRIIEGAIRPITCLLCDKDAKGEEFTRCGFYSICAMKDLWTKVYKATIDIVDNITLARLIEETKKFRGDYNDYQI